MEAVEYDHIVEVLERTDWKISGKDGTAEILGFKFGTLRARMQKLGIRKPYKGLWVSFFTLRATQGMQGSGLFDFAIWI